MFLPSRLHHRSCAVKCESFVTEEFSLLCWNVHKNNTKSVALKSYFESIEDDYDFFLLQEANFRDDAAFTLPNFAFDAAANLEVKKTFYGVLTASRVESRKSEAFLSQGKESLFGPHKSLLLSSYLFADNTELLILNVHAINFRESKSHQKELERFLTLISHHKGPLIVAGDFNTWNKTRMQNLETLIADMGLKSVPFMSTDAVKSFMGKPLDFILYRDLALVSAHCESLPKLSDHNPLFATFKKV
ncbi:MAG: endonuclease/exonuclease/phosphatase family protein [Sulfurovum sp.]|nr:endonuclease/exonuclease/phosphatase family protein [Sulfurovum sp.]